MSLPARGAFEPARTDFSSMSSHNSHANHGGPPARASAHDSLLANLPTRAAFTPAPTSSFGAPSGERERSLHDRDPLNHPVVDFRPAFQPAPPMAGVASQPHSSLPEPRIPIVDFRPAFQPAAPSDPRAPFAPAAAALGEPPRNSALDFDLGSRPAFSGAKKSVLK